MEQNENPFIAQFYPSGGIRWHGLFSPLVKMLFMDYSLNLSSPWAEVKERIQEAHLDFSDEDLDYTPGQEKQLLERVAAKLGKDVEAAKGWVESVAYTQRVAS